MKLSDNEIRDITHFSVFLFAGFHHPSRSNPQGQAEQDCGGEGPDCESE